MDPRIPASRRLHTNVHVPIWRRVAYRPCAKLLVIVFTPPMQRNARRDAADGTNSPGRWIAVGAQVEQNPI